MMKNIIDLIKEKIRNHKKLSIIALLLFLLIGGTVGYVLLTNNETNHNPKVTQTNNQNKNPDTNVTGSNNAKKKEDKKYTVLSAGESGDIYADSAEDVIDIDLSDFEE